MRSSTSRGYTAPVGLFGLITTSARVRGVISDSISSGSGLKAVLGTAAVVHGTSAVERHGRRPQRIVGRRHQHFVAVVQQRPQRHVDELGGAIADEDGLGGARRCTPRCCCCSTMASRAGIDALLVDSSLRPAAGSATSASRRISGRAKSVGAGIADVQRDDLVALPFQLDGAPRQGAADLVADIVQVWSLALMRHSFFMPRV